MKSYAKLVLMAAFAVLFLSTLAAADTPGVHPAYLHALSNLRAARAYLSLETANYNLNANETYAIQAIDAAIQVIKEAAIDDGKPLSDHPPVDVNLGRLDRLNRARVLLEQTEVELNQRESDAYVNGLKHRALSHINDAWKNTKRAINPTWHE
jgi:hypothetical protein